MNYFFKRSEYIFSCSTIEGKNVFQFTVIRPSVKKTFERYPDVV